MYFKNGALSEDSGTGSACSNLGGLQVLEGNNDFEWTIRQGCLLGRENILFLKVTANQEIWIGGQNRFMGKGELLWAD
jgi:predicted PhzF superfamily epimerase YddE/YHI9